MIAESTPEDEEAYEEFVHALGAFMVEFANVESFFLTHLLGALSNDLTLADCVGEHVPSLRDRLKVLKALARAPEKALSPGLIARVTKLANEVTRLSEFRNDVAHNAPRKIHLASKERPGGREFFVGTPKRASDRKPGPAFVDDPQELAGILKGWHYSVAALRDHTKTAVNLRTRMFEITIDLWEHRDGMPGPTITQTAPDGGLQQT